MKFKLLLLFSLMQLAFQDSKAQNSSTQFSGYGYLEYELDFSGGPTSYFYLGEHSFFVNSKLNDKISFLGEYVIRFNGNSATSFLPSIERSLVKYNYYKNHNIIVGKIHTPVNYWNDSYHHGRLFFPVMDRPISFSYLVPLHTLGIQFQGQNLGDLNFGYDFVIGNGISSSDILSDAKNTSFTAAVHIKPTDGMRIGASFYYDFLDKNRSGIHSGHAAPRTHYTGKLYAGALNYTMTSLSFANFNKSYEILNEFTYNTTSTDSMGLAKNFANFLYAGLRFKDKHTPYVVVDFMKIASNDLHTYPYEVGTFGIGYKYEFSPLVNLKSQVQYDRQMVNHANHSIKRYFGFEFQLAYGF